MPSKFCEVDDIDEDRQFAHFYRCYQCYSVMIVDNRLVGSYMLIDILTDVYYHVFPDEVLSG